MRCRLAIPAMLVGLTLSPGPARAEQLVTSLSNYRVSISSNFTGETIVLFGTVDRDAATVPRRGGYDIVVTVLGPRQTMMTWRKERILGIWINAESRTFVDAPSYAAVLANRSIQAITDRELRRRLQLGLNNILLPQEIAGDVADVVREDPFRTAFLRLQSQRGLYLERTDGVTFLTATLFRAGITLPATAPIGTYQVDVKLFADGAMITRETSAFELYKSGVEQLVATAARSHGFLYGLTTVALGLAVGWLATVVFRRD
jgi:uncharacterized protein (TIGR02186 family)